MRHSQRNLCLAFLFATAVADGATPYEGDLPIELARYFTGGGYWYSDLPDDFPPFVLPAGMQVMGSLDQTQRKQVILTTTLERDTALEALANAFREQDGWIRAPVPAAAAFKPRGFVEQERLDNPPTTVRPIRLCNDNYGGIQIDSIFSPDTVYMSFMSSGSGRPRTNRSSCAQGRAIEQQMVAPSTNFVWLNTPALALPKGTTILGNRLLITDGPTPENEFQTSVRLNAARQSLTTLNRNFARQMRRQGWKRDKQWTGDISAGSNWTMKTDDDQQLSAFISIVRVAENDYDLDMRLFVPE